MSEQVVFRKGEKVIHSLTGGEVTIVKPIKNKDKQIIAYMANDGKAVFRAANCELEKKRWEKLHKDMDEHEDEEHVYF